MASVHQSATNQPYDTKETRRISPTPHFNYETYYQHQEKQPSHTNPLLQYLSQTELKFRNDNLYETEEYRLPRRTDILNRYVRMNPNFEHLNRVYEPNLTQIEKQRYRRCVEQQQQKLHRIQKKFDFQTADGHNSHYFLTGARYNRFDTVDSKILLKYGTFVNRNNPEQVDIKASHFKKFREILQAQQRSSSGGGKDTARREGTDFDLIGERGQEEDLEDLTNRYERNSSRQSNLKPAAVGRRHRLPKLKDPARYADVASQMPERRRGRRSLDRAISSSSTHRSARHRRHSQHQAQQQQQQQPQQSPAQQSSVSYVANKVSFSLVNEGNPSLMAANKPTGDEDELRTTDAHEHHYHQQQQQQASHDVPGESIDDEGEEEDIQTKQDDDDDDDPILVAQLREHANVIVADILSSAMDQINVKSHD